MNTRRTKNLVRETNNDYKNKEKNSVFAQQTQPRGKKKLSHGKNQVYIGNEILVHGTKS
jgi:hypothetical protein